MKVRIKRNIGPYWFKYCRNYYPKAYVLVIGPLVFSYGQFEEDQQQ